MFANTLKLRMGIMLADVDAGYLNQLLSLLYLQECFQAMQIMVATNILLMHQTITQ